LAAKEGLDDVGRVLDFSMIKTLLCEWLERNWDHKTLLWENDPLSLVTEIASTDGWREDLSQSFVVVPFNPTAENMGLYLLEMSAILLSGTEAHVTKIVIEETRKCSIEVNV
jgi:6-pyruvoyltetrahydropterin/6-carboxytetrahydropterin synthase